MAFTINIDYLVKRKIMHWVNSSANEVSGLGKIICEDGVIRVIDAFLLPQENSSAATDIDATHVAKALYETRNTPGELRFWWHSHANMGVFWSGTDRETLKMLSEQGWFVATVFNKKNETKTCIQMGKPFSLLIDDLVLSECLPDISAETIIQWNSEYQSNVKVKTYENRGYGWRDSQFLSKKERRRLKKEEKERKKIGGLAPSVSTENIPPECPICTKRYTCECDKEKKAKAIELENAGVCWECEKPFEECLCSGFSSDHSYFCDKCGKVEKYCSCTETKKLLPPSKAEIEKAFEKEQRNYYE